MLDLLHNQVDTTAPRPSQARAFHRMKEKLFQFHSIDRVAKQRRREDGNKFNFKSQKRHRGGGKSCEQTFLESSSVFETLQKQKLSQHTTMSVYEELKNFSDFHNCTNLKKKENLTLGAHVRRFNYEVVEVFQPPENEKHK